MREKFLKFVAEIFDVNPSEISMETGFKTVEIWDSLMHLRLVAEISDKYNVEIPIDEIAEIKTLGDFYKYIIGENK